MPSGDAIAWPRTSRGGVTPSDWPANVQRIWFVTDGQSACVVGAVLVDAVSGLTRADARGFRGVLVFSRSVGRPVERVSPDGRAFLAVPQAPAGHQLVESADGAFEGLDAVLAEMARLRDVLLARGWFEVSFDPIGDPDGI